HLDRHPPAEFFVLRLEHITHAAMPQLANETELSQASWHPGPGNVGLCGPPARSFCPGKGWTTSFRRLTHAGDQPPEAILRNRLLGSPVGKDIQERVAGCQVFEPAGIARIALEPGADRIDPFGVDSSQEETAEFLRRWNRQTRHDAPPGWMARPSSRA